MASRKLRGRGIAAAGIAAVLGMHLSAAYANAIVFPAGIPFKATAAADDNLVYRAIAAFVVAGAVAYGLAWCIKRYMPSFGKQTNRDKQLERLEIMRLSARSLLVRVRWGNDELLLGESEHGITLLGTRPLPVFTSEAEDTVATKENHA
jgi:flagellar biogenesis protein FliO